MTKRETQRLYTQIAVIRARLKKAEEAKWIRQNRWKIDTYWKYENSYGNDTPKWFVYARVTGLDGSMFQVKTFETTCYGVIIVGTKELNLLPGFVQTTEEEYVNEYRKLCVLLYEQQA